MLRQCTGGVYNRPGVLRRGRTEEHAECGDTSVVRRRNGQAHGLRLAKTKIALT